MNILVIGNGFDLAHELPTRYSDFLNFVKSYKGQDPVYRDFINGLSQRKKKEIENLLDNNLLLNYFLDIYHNMLCNGRDNWIDFETEISSVVQAFDNSLDEIKSKTEKSGRKEIKISHAYFEKIERFNYNSKNEYQKCLGNRISIDFLEETIKMVYVDLEKVIRLLEIYLNDYVGKIDINFKLKEFESIKIDHVLSFNYTNTYRKLYDPGNGCDYCFLHGMASSDSSVDTCNMVLGINEYLECVNR